jgi:hypothetical protein
MVSIASRREENFEPAMGRKMQVMGRDRHQEFKWALFRETCSKILENPALIDEGRRHIERVMAQDPRMTKYYAL